MYAELSCIGGKTVVTILLEYFHSLISFLKLEYCSIPNQFFAFQNQNYAISIVGLAPKGAYRW